MTTFPTIPDAAVSAAARDVRADALRDTLRRAYAELGDRPFSYSEYERWRRETHPDWPEAATIARELGSQRWLTALAAAGIPSVSEHRQASIATRRGHVGQLRRQGLKTGEIAKRVGASTHTIARDIARLTALGQNGQPRQRKPQHHPLP